MAGDNADETAAGRFAHLAATLAYLQERLDMHIEADDMFASLHRKTRTRIEANSEDITMNAVYALARTNPTIRHEERLRIENAIRELTELMEDKEFLPMTRHTREDLQLILRFIDAVAMLKARSRFDLARFFDALRANDVGYLIAVTLPFRGNTKQKLEIRFAHQLPAETRSALDLPKPPQQWGETEHEN